MATADERALAAVIKRRLRPTRKLVEDGLARVRAQASTTQIDEALDVIDWRAVTELYDFDEMLPHSVLKADEFTDDVILETMRQAGSIGFDLDVTDPFVIQKAQRQAGDLVTSVSRTSKRAIREAVVGGVRSELSRPEVVRQIRAAVGLTPQQVTHQQNYRAALDAVRDGRMSASTVKARYKLGDSRWSARTLTSARAESLTKRYAERALTDRAKNIAITETIKASNAGRVESWKQAIGDGFLPGTSAMQWLTADDERVCPQCWPMNGQIVEIVAGPMFESTQLGKEGDTKRDRPGPPVVAAHPPLHSRCRCVVVLTDL